LVFLQTYVLMDFLFKREFLQDSSRSNQSKKNKDYEKNISNRRCRLYWQ